MSGEKLRQSKMLLQEASSRSATKDTRATDSDMSTFQDSFNAGENPCKGKRLLRVAPLRTPTEDMRATDSELAALRTSFSDTDSDSSDSDAEVDDVVDAYAARIRAPEGEKPARMRPCFGIRNPDGACLPLVENDSQPRSKETQEKSGQTSAETQFQLPRQTRVLDRSAFVTGSVKIASRANPQEVAVTADVDVRRRPSFQDRTKGGDDTMHASKERFEPKRLNEHRFVSTSVQMPKIEVEQSKLSARRFVSVPCNPVLENECPLPTLTSEKKVQPALQIPSRFVAPAHEVKCVNHERPPSCSYTSGHGAATQNGDHSARNLGYSPLHAGGTPRHSGRARSLCPVFSNKIDVKRCGTQCNTVQFNSTPSQHLATLRNDLVPLGSKERGRQNPPSQHLENPITEHLTQAL